MAKFLINEEEIAGLVQKLADVDRYDYVNEDGARELVGEITKVNDETTGINLLRGTRDFTVGSKLVGEGWTTQYYDGFYIQASFSKQIDDLGFTVLHIEHKGTSWLNTYSSAILVEPGDTFTVSMDYMVDNVEDATFSNGFVLPGAVQVYRLDTKAVLQSSDIQVKPSEINDGEWKHVVKTFTVKEDLEYEGDIILRIRLQLASGGSVYFRKVKLESGEINNPIWSPSPFDVAQDDNVILANKESGQYYGMRTPNDSNKEWIRTTSNGLIPYSPNVGQIGSSGWKFNKIYANDFYGYFNGAALRADTVSNNGGGGGYAYNGALWFASNLAKYFGMVTGSIKIALPHEITTSSSTANMIRFKVSIFDYKANAALCDFWITGYVYPKDENWWNATTSAVSLCHPSYKNANVPIKFGKTADAIPVVEIGESTTEWNYLHVVVSEVIYGNNKTLNVSDWKIVVDDSISIATLAKTITNPCLFKDPIETPVSISNGGTEAKTALDARNNLFGSDVKQANDIQTDDIRFLHHMADNTNRVTWRSGPQIFTWIAKKIRETFGFNDDNVLPIKNGGTGASDQLTAQYNLLNKITAASSTSEVSDTTKFTMQRISMSAATGALATYTGTQVWSWILGKIRSVLGFNSNNVLPIENGGTDATTSRAAQYNLLKDMGTVAANNVTDSRYFILEDSSPNATNGAIVRAAAMSVWGWIASKIGINTSATTTMLKNIRPALYPLKFAFNNGSTDARYQEYATIQLPVGNGFASASFLVTHTHNYGARFGSYLIEICGRGITTTAPNVNYAIQVTRLSKENISTAPKFWIYLDNANKLHFGLTTPAYTSGACFTTLGATGDSSLNFGNLSDTTTKPSYDLIEADIIDLITNRVVATVDETIAYLQS